MFNSWQSLQSFAEWITESCICYFHALINKAMLLFLNTRQYLSHMSSNRLWVLVLGMLVPKIEFSFLPAGQLCFYEEIPNLPKLSISILYYLIKSCVWPQVSLSFARICWIRICISPFLFFIFKLSINTSYFI